MGVLLLILGAGLLYILSQNSSASTGSSNAAYEQGMTSTDPTTGQSVTTYNPPAPNPNPPGGGNVTDANVQAFLALIRTSEGTAQYADPWGTFYGGQQFTDKSAHPCETWNGRPPVIAPVELGNGLFDTAAGAYQITLSTWNLYGGTAHYGDFSNASQDQCAADIIANISGAQADIDAGNISQAQSDLASQWASFTAANLASNNAAYQAAGGTFVS